MFQTYNPRYTTQVMPSISSFSRAIFVELSSVAGHMAARRSSILRQDLYT